MRVVVPSDFTWKINYAQYNEEIADKLLTEFQAGRFKIDQQYGTVTFNIARNQNVTSEHLINFADSYVKVGKWKSCEYKFNQDNTINIKLEKK